MPLKCSDYFCVAGSKANENDRCIRRPISASLPGVLSPYVRMFFPPMNGKGGGTGKGDAGGQIITTIDPAGKPDLTVGNDSNMPNNHAGIISFQYGGADGNGAEVEIFDEEGGEFDLLVNKLVKVIPDAYVFGCGVEWGWIMTDCAGNKIRSTRSSPHFFIIKSIDMNYTSGGILFKVYLQDTMETLFETRVNDVIQGVDLKTAITKLFTEKSNPKIDSVLFKRMTPGAGGIVPCTNLVDDNNLGNQSSTVNLKNLQDFKFKGNLEKGTTDWPCNGATPLAIVKEWLKDKMTDNDKAVIIFWNSTSINSELVFLEDPLPKCWSSIEQQQCSTSIGTYIINGGENSPVISFDPQIKFNFGAASHSGAGVDTLTAEAKSAQPDVKCPENNPVNNPLGSGDTLFITMSENFNQIYGPGNLRLAIRGIAANEKANKLYENIEAELKIQGDPSLDHPYTIQTKTVSLVVINPFHLRASGGNEIISGQFLPGCPEWLSGPPCNRILSNKNWIIKAVSHEIKGGSYTTTLKINLPAPGKIA